MVFAAPLWHCTATNKQNAEWYQYGQTREDARSGVEQQCVFSDKEAPCQITCVPPRIYWRCVSRDTPVDITKRMAWYWASYSQTVAMNGARDACRHNSLVGGCYVEKSSCASS